MSFSLNELLKLHEQKMALDLRSKLIEHRGELGRGREAVIREFLRSYLPKRFEVSTGFIFDCHGNVSEQMDIVIADGVNGASFELLSGVTYFPCESVLAVGQVKSTVDSKSKLRNALKNIESVKRLDRSANGMAYCEAKDSILNPTEDYLDQVFGFVFITGKSLTRESLVSDIGDYVFMNGDRTLWPNLIFSFESYLATWACPNGACPNTMHTFGGLSLLEHSEASNILARFYLLLGQALEVTRTSSLPYWEYLSPPATDWSTFSVTREGFEFMVGDP